MTIGIVGLGYVGLPLAVAFAEAGERVDRRRHERGQGGLDPRAGSPTSRTSRRSSSPAVRLAARGHDAHLAPGARATRSSSRVPTPLTANREPDLGPLLGAAQSVADVLQAGQLVVLESTTYPGTTRERLLPILEETGLVAGRRLPPRLLARARRPGQRDATRSHNTPKIIGGLTPACARPAEGLYGLVCESVVPVSTPEVAEMAKLLENIFRSVNIALVNELGDARRPDEHRHLRGHRRRRDQAVRLHALRAGPGHGRPLPAGRPVLPVLEGPRATTSRPSSSSSPARSTRHSPTSASSAPSARSTSRARPSGLQDRRPRRRLQARRRRHPRVARR